MFLSGRVLLLLFYAYTWADAHRILVYSLRFGQSHVFFMGKIADVLKEAGHEVVFYQHELFDEVTNNGSRLADIWLRRRDFDVAPLPNVWEVGSRPEKEWLMYENIGRGIATACYHQLRDRELMERLRAKKFDLAIGEHFDVCAYALFDELGIKKHISAYAAPMYPAALEQLGHPITTAYVPVTNNFGGTFVERCLAFLMRPLSTYVYATVFEQPVKDAVRNALGRDVDFNAAFIRSSYAFVNVDEHLDFHQPTSQKVVYVGGITQEERPPPLSREFQSILDESAGTVLVSFGTVTQSWLMPNETRRVLKEVFRRHATLTFLLKHEDAAAFGGLRNVRTAAWIPQAAVLAHPKTLAFITHGGLNSVSEAAFHGVPALCIPMFGDQERNCKMAEARGVARLLRRDDITVATLANAVHEVVNDVGLREAARTMSNMMRTKPFKPRERVVGFVDHAIRFDISTAHDLPSRHFNFIQYYGIDVYFTLGFISFLIMHSAYRIAIKVYYLTKGLLKLKSE